MTKFSCEVCGITVKSEQCLTLHNEGSAHKKEVARQKQLKELEEKSIFLTSFKHPASEESIRQALASFGQIDRVILDRKAGKFAIVEFSNEESVQTMLKQKSIKIGQDKANIKKRRVDFGKHEQKPGTSEGTLVDTARADILKFTLEELNGDPRLDLQKIFEKYKRASTYAVTVFLPHLLTFTQSYFNEPIKMIVFGSTATGLAAYNSDVDICLITKEPNNESFSLETSTSNIASSSDIMQQSIADLHVSKIPLIGFNGLKKSDKVKLLTRIFNEFRKQTGLVDNLKGVDDAKCPIVRFSMSSPDNNESSLDCEVSVNNFLGTHKSLFVKNALSDDLLLILFCIRIWGSCFKLFKEDEKSVGYWSSYALSLVFVQFCQLQGYISAVKNEGTETIDGWPVQYTVSEIPSPQWTLDEFLMNFFKFTASVFNRPTVLSIRNACLYSVEEFKEEFKGNVADNFKFGLVNVQDPIQLDHNVTANVSSAYLKALRGNGMRVLCNLKADSSNPIRALFADKSEKKPQVPTSDQAMDSVSEKKPKVSDQPVEMMEIPVVNSIADLSSEKNVETMIDSVADSVGDSIAEPTNKRRKLE